MITSFFVFRVNVQLFANFSIFGGIELKFGGVVNSETLISYFMSILPCRMNLIKITRFKDVHDRKILHTEFFKVQYVIIQAILK